MQLSYISMSNFRSITNAYKLDLNNLTVLLAKNNRGKTNIIRAILLSMNILNNITYIRNNGVSKRFYNWEDDFPVKLQKSKKSRTKILKSDWIFF